MTREAYEIANSRFVVPVQWLPVTDLGNRPWNGSRLKVAKAEAPDRPTGQPAAIAEVWSSWAEDTFETLQQIALQG